MGVTLCYTNFLKIKSSKNKKIRETKNVSRRIKLEVDRKPVENASAQTLTVYTYM